MRASHRRILSHLMVPLVPLLGACSEAGGARGLQSSLDLSNVPTFYADSAFALLERQVAFGPRVPGLPGHAEQLSWMTTYLRERADTLIVQPFQHDADGVTLDMMNLFARFRPDLNDRILLIAHWDTRPTADNDRDRDRRDDPIPGANDGGSGVAVLLHLAHIMSAEPPPIGVDLLLVDGEDYGPFESNMYLGAKHFAATTAPGYSPLYGILLDMIGDANPVYPIEGYSESRAPEVIQRVWGLAEQLGYSDAFPRRRGTTVTDDHVPLNDAGIRTIDIIDFDYGPGNIYWHTHGDTVENTSPRGLGIVGTVLTTLIYTGG